MKKKYIIILIFVLFVALVGVVSLNRSSFSLPKNEINEEVINDEPLTNPDVLNDDYEGPQENELVQDNNKDNHEQKNSDSSDSNKTSTVDTKKTEKASEKEEKKPDEAIKEPTTKPAIEKDKDSNTEQNISPAIDDKESTGIETVPAIVETTSAIEVNTSEPAINIDSPIENEEPKIEPENKNDTETTPEAVTQELPVIPKNDQAPSNEKTEARVQYVMKINPSLSLDEAQLIVNEFELFANARDYLDVEVLMSISRLESGFKPHIGTNYFGLMQVSGKYGNIAGYTNEQLLTPHYNIEYACSILDDCYKKLDGNLIYTLMGYNQGYYGLKAKLDAGTELNFAFVERCIRYINEITAMYPQ